MCFAIPGKIIKIENNIAFVAYPHQKRKAKIVTGTYKTGDYIIVQANIVIEKVPKAQAETWVKFVKQESR